MNSLVQKHEFLCIFQASAVKTLSGLDLSAHRKTSMSDNYDLYHRMVGTDEIEMVLKVKTDTWIGVGWKPTGSQSCRKGYIGGIP